MRQVVCREFAPVEKLALEEAPDPRLRPGEVVIAVRAAGVNFVDALLVQGLYQIKPALPFTPGGEIAGEIIEIGAGVDGRALGERVVVSCGLGGFVELPPGERLEYWSPFEDGGAREAVDENDRVALPSLPVADAMAENLNVARVG